MHETVSKPSPDQVSAISQERIEKAVQARYSPFPDLSMATLVAQLNNFRIGDLRSAARTWEIMIERDGDLAVPADKLFSDISRLPWDIEKEEESAEADAHAEFLRYFYTHLTATSVLDGDETGGLNLLLRQLMTAHAHRYSIHEMLLRINSADKKEVTAEFRHCPVWFFEARKGRLAYLPEEFSMYGEPLESGRWLAAVGRGMMRPCSIAYFCKWGPMSDWMLFAKRFGIPGIHGETSAGKGSAEWDDFAEALRNFANDWITQTSMGQNKISLVEASKGGTGTLPFAELVERSDRLYARCFRGGDLSTQSRAGGDVAGANPQEGEKQIVMQDGGQWATDILNARVDETMIAYAFDSTPKAWIVIRPPKQLDSAREAAALKTASELKIPVSIDTARERLDLPAPEEGDELISEPAPAPIPGMPGERAAGVPPEGPSKPISTEDDSGEPALDNTASAEQQFRQAIAAQVNPVLAVLARISEIKDDAQMLAALQNFVAQSDRFAALATADVSRVQNALAQVTAPALAAGLAGKQKT